jgi:hypothetical protein
MCVRSNYCDKQQSVYFVEKIEADPGSVYEEEDYFTVGESEG